MHRKPLTVKNVSIETLEMLRELRIEERRQLSAILEDCVQSYWDSIEEEGCVDPEVGIAA